VVALLLIAFPSLLADLPQTTLAAVVIIAALSLVDVAALRRFWRVRKTSLALSLVATAGVIFFGVLEGIIAAIVLSVALFFQRSWWPHGELLGEFGDGWHSRQHAKTTEPGQRSGVIVFRWEAPLFFANAGMFRQQLRHHVREHQPRWVVLQCEAIMDIDVTAAEMLERLDNELNEVGIHIAFVELRSRLHDLLSQYGLLGTLDRDHFYGTIEEALAAIEAEDAEKAKRARGSSAPAQDDPL
jgi:MFS superfamily sulfate permease-like transporter